MSRTNKPRGGSWKGFGGHSYRSKHPTKKDARIHHKRQRHEVHEQLKDVLFTDAFDEKEMLGKKAAHLWNTWMYD